MVETRRCSVIQLPSQFTYLFLAIPAAIVVLFVIIVATHYVKAAPTEAVVVTGAFHKKPKVVSGRGVIVLPIIQRADKISMRVMKLDVKTPPTGVKTSEGVPLWIDSVVTIQVYSDTSTISPEEVKASGLKNREELVKMRQQAAISNFLGSQEADFNNKVNDILQGNLREIVAEMSVMDVLTKRKEFASRVIENAKPDLAKVGLEVVTFNIQDIQDAVDACGQKHGVVEAIGVEREMEVRRQAEIARANAARDIAVAQADANRESAEKKSEADTKIAEARTKQALREADLKAQADKAQADANAAGLIQAQVQEKTRRQAEAIRAKALAEAEGIEKKAEAQSKMGEASKLEMLYTVLPQVAHEVASILAGVDNVTLYGTDTASKLMSDTTQGVAQFVNAFASGSGESINVNALAGAALGAKFAGKTSGETSGETTK